MKRRSIIHLSHGIIPTGGFRHEQFLLHKLTDHYRQQGFEVKKETIRANRFFKGLAQLRLLAWSFRHTRADVNIVVARTALSAILRNVFTSNKVLIVLHYFDTRDGKGLLLKWYYNLLFALLRLGPRHVAIVAVAPFWVDFFQQKLQGKVPVLLFPNFFDTEQYKPFAGTEKTTQIHLGQYSFKNDPRIFELAKLLAAQGFPCYFSTMLKEEAGTFDGYSVRLEDYPTYLGNMARSQYTVAYIGINEGWNRVAHESLLVGTTLIGNPAGGLGDLLKESGSLTANEPQQFVEQITAQRHPLIDPAFIARYDEQHAGVFLQDIVSFIDAE